MREIKLSYMYQHEETGEWMDFKYTIKEMDRGEVSKMDHLTPRYTLIARRQYTGLKDSQGVDIYEGDIVLLNDYYMGDDGYEDALAVTEWHEHDCGFVFRIIENSCGGRIYVFEYPAKVVGNKYENPELLTN